MTHEVLRLAHQPHVGLDFAPQGHALIRVLAAPDADVRLQRTACAGGGCSARGQRPSIAAAMARVFACARVLLVND